MLKKRAWRGVYLNVMVIKQHASGRLFELEYDKTCRGRHLFEL